MKKRIISFVIVFSLISCAVTARVGYIAYNNSADAGTFVNSYTLSVAKKELTIYDCNKRKLNYLNKKYAVVIRPNKECISELKKVFSEYQCQNIIDDLKSGFPVVRFTKEKVDCKYLKFYEVYDKYSDNQLCAHLISSASSGIENYIGTEQFELKISFPQDANGRILSGSEGELVSNYDTDKGVCLTIDSSIQRICEKALGNKKGAVVVTDVKTGNILALASGPRLDLTNPENANNDYLNRAINSYAVGSVFKIFVAACALENNINPTYECTGKIKIHDTEFHCSDSTVHGKQNMKKALANSCNCYFINLALKIGSERIIEFADKLGFGCAQEIYPSFFTKSGILPAPSTDGQTALLGFGQGRLSATPIQVAAAIGAIANNGIFHSPNLRQCDISDNSEKINILPPSKGIRVMSEKTAQTLCEYMKYVVTNGTASSAQSKSNKSAGKTSTAQTGIYENGEELYNAWFAGFYPCDNPKYSITILREAAISGSIDCCPIFKTIVDNLEFSD